MGTGTEWIHWLKTEKKAEHSLIAVKQLSSIRNGGDNGAQFGYLEMNNTEVLYREQQRGCHQRLT